MYIEMRPYPLAAVPPLRRPILARALTLPLRTRPAVECGPCPAVAGGLLRRWVHLLLLVLLFLRLRPRRSTWRWLLIRPFCGLLRLRLHLQSIVRTRRLLLPPHSCRVCPGSLLRLRLRLLPQFLALLSQFLCLMSLLLLVSLLLRALDVHDSLCVRPLSLPLLLPPRLHRPPQLCTSGQ